MSQNVEELQWRIKNNLDLPVKLSPSGNANIAAAAPCFLASWDVDILEFEFIPLSLQARTDRPCFFTLGELPSAGTAQPQWEAEHFLIKLWLSPLFNLLSCLLGDWSNLASSCPGLHLSSAGAAGLQPVLLMGPSQLGPGHWPPSHLCKTINIPPYPKKSELAFNRKN